ncbi:MAG TPA: MBL fold metallo-hydrolase [Candidatus Acidoferrales bacterium]|nr:MBL fold metallo-hydrolase [Candidatus Acidoferrales bacterium]
MPETDVLEDRQLGHVTVLFGARGGKYPHGNSLLVRGSAETLLIDPSLSIIPRRERLPRIDRVVNSHCHEDHIAGNHLFPAIPWHLHELDLPGIQSIDNMMAIYGYTEPIGNAFRHIVEREFHFTPRPEAVAFRDGDVFDLGGVRVRVIHAPGHTRGHCLFHIEPDDVVYLGDIDLTSFGPYYGDAWSSLEDFERTLRAVRQIEARWYATFHHIGVLEGRTAFLERLDRFAAVIQSREHRLVEFLAEPRTLDDIVAHRFVYRPQDDVPFAAAVERRSMSQHVERLLRAGRVREVEPGSYHVLA